MPAGENYKNDLRLDNISHFICRMLYCQEDTNHQTFVSIEKRILEERLQRNLKSANESIKENIMNLMKKMLAVFKGKDSSSVYDVSGE